MTRGAPTCVRKGRLRRTGAVRVEVGCSRALCGTVVLPDGRDTQVASEEGAGVQPLLRASILDLQRTMSRHKSTRRTKGQVKHRELNAAIGPCLTGARRRCEPEFSGDSRGPKSGGRAQGSIILRLRAYFLNPQTHQELHGEHSVQVREHSTTLRLDAEVGLAPAWHQNAVALHTQSLHQHFNRLVLAHLGACGEAHHRQRVIGKRCLGAARILGR